MTTTAVALPDSPTGQALALIGPAGDLVEKIANTSFVPKDYRGKPAELLAAILTGQELGLGPMTAIAEVHNIEGRASLSAKAMRALVLSRGHHISVVKTTPEECTIVGWRAGEDKPTDGSNRFTWTLAMARAAGLQGKKNWRSFPQAMLLARATGEMCRAIFADVLAGISYTEEELQDGFDLETADGFDVDDDPPPAPVTSTTRSLPKKKAKKAAKKAPAPSAAADPMADFDDIDGTAVQPPAADPDDEPVDAEIVDPDDDQTADVGDDQPRMQPAQMLAMRSGEAGIPEEHRHGFYLAVTGGKHRSGKTMSPDDIRAVLDVLDQKPVLKVIGPTEWEVEIDGDAEFWFADEPAAVEQPEFAEVVELADDHQSWDGARWKAEAKAAGLSAVDIMRHLSKFRSSDPTIPEGDTSSLVKLAASTSEDLKDEARRFIESGGSK